MCEDLDINYKPYISYYLIYVLTLFYQRETYEHYED